MHRFVINFPVFYIAIFTANTVSFSSGANSVVVETLPTNDSALNQPLIISIALNDGSRLVTSHKFFYRLNPRFTNIEPRNHLIVYVRYVYVCVFKKITNNPLIVPICIVIYFVLLFSSSFIIVFQFVCFMVLMSCVCICVLPVWRNKRY